MTVVCGGRAVYRNPVTVVELLDFKISAELLHINRQTHEKRWMVCKDRGRKSINMLLLIVSLSADSAFREPPLADLLLITANWKMSLKLALKRSRQRTGKWSGSSLLICRKRSGRADECSGPWGQDRREKTWQNGRRRILLKKSTPNNPKAFTDAAGFRASSHHSLHPVWQQQDDAVVADPLGLAWADELVYDALGCVMKISKLGFPEDESIWTGHGKTQLETWSQLLSRRAPNWFCAHVGLMRDSLT